MSSFIFKGSLMSLGIVLMGSLLSNALGDPFMINPLHVIGVGALFVLSILLTIMAIVNKMGEGYVAFGAMMSIATLAALIVLNSHVQTFESIISGLGK